MRADNGLGFLLQYENVAWYEDGVVKILDRRIYPVRIEHVVCKTHQEVAQAITDMVTQSGGPYTAAAMGMALAAYEAKDKKGDELYKYLEDAAYTLSHARPTTSAKMVAVVEGCLKVAKEAMASGAKLDEAIATHAVNELETKYQSALKLGGYMVDMFPERGSIMTMCFAETAIGGILKVAKDRGKDIKVYCCETRPYFQGARLTASVAKDQGYDVTVITDNMPGYTMKAKGIDVFTSAADVITMDGYVVNKVGTFQVALCAQYWGVPYYVTGSPDPKHLSIDSVQIEERDPDFVCQAMGVKTTLPGVKGYYPSFDITPPKMVDAVVSSKGVYSPRNLKSFFEDGTELSKIV